MKKGQFISRVLQIAIQNEQIFFAAFKFWLATRNPFLVSIFAKKRVSNKFEVKDHKLPIHIPPLKLTIRMR